MTTDTPNNTIPLYVIDDKQCHKASFSSEMSFILERLTSSWDKPLKQENQCHTDSEHKVSIIEELDENLEWQRIYAKCDCGKFLGESKHNG